MHGLIVNSSGQILIPLGGADRLMPKYLSNRHQRAFVWSVWTFRFSKWVNKKPALVLLHCLIKLGQFGRMIKDARIFVEKSVEKIGRMNILLEQGLSMKSGSELFPEADPRSL